MCARINCNNIAIMRVRPKRVSSTIDTRVSQWLRMRTRRVADDEVSKYIHSECIEQCVCSLPLRRSVNAVVCAKFKHHGRIYKCNMRVIKERDSVHNVRRAMALMFKSCTRLHRLSTLQRVCARNSLHNAYDIANCALIIVLHLRSTGTTHLCQPFFLSLI